MSRSLLILSLTLVLGGCLAQSQIQSKYMSHESTCRDEAQDRTEAAQAQAEATGGRMETAVTLASAFSECMNKQGWKISGPKMASRPQQPPLYETTVPSSARAAATPTARDGQSNTTGAPSAAPILGPGVQPSPQPAYTPDAKPAAANTRQPMTPAPAASAPTAYPQGTSGVSTYQPARPDGTDVPEYGSGAGRQF